MMTYRQFEVQVLIGGQTVPGLYFKSFEIDANRYESCDAASVVFALDTFQESTSSFWFEQAVTDAIGLVIQMRDRAVVAMEWENIFEGQVDHIQYFPDQGLVEVQCRDALASLLDLRVQESWLNHTGEELLEGLIKAAGLSAQVSFPPEAASAMSGQFWQVEHKRLSLISQHRFQTAADIAFTIARDAGCDLYAEGKTIICAPIPSSDDPIAHIHDLRGAVLSRSFGRDMQAERGFVVHMASWDSRQRSITGIYYDGKSFSDAAPGTESGVYSFRVPGRRLEDLKKLAVGKYARIAAHTRSGHVRLPGIMELKPRHFILLGDGVWQQALAIDRIISRFSLEDGFVQDLVARDRRGTT